MIREEIISVTTTGSDASAVGTGYSKISVAGKVLAIRFNFHASAPTTTDVAVTENHAVPQTLCTETSSKTDVVRYPRRALEDNAEAGVEYASGYPVRGKYVVNGQLKVAVAQANALTGCVVVGVIYET